MLWLALACVPDPKPDARRPDGDSPPGDTASDSGDTAADSADTGGPGSPPTADALFVVESCGFDDEGILELQLVPDRDGDGDEDVLVIVRDDDPEIAGVWLVPSTAAPGPYWDQPIHWDTQPERIVALPDLDGDGLGELYGVTGQADPDLLLPDGSIQPTTSPYVTAIPWHDLDGDGRAELLVGAPTAEGTPFAGQLAVVSAPDADPTTWTPLVTIAAETADALGAVLVRALDDGDGDGHADVIVGDGDGYRLLASAEIDGGASLSAATRAAFDSEVGEPMPLGDVDGGGLEDVAFAEGYLLSIARGEDPDDAARYEKGIGSHHAWTYAVGPDGAGGRALWAGGFSLAAYDVAAALEGRAVQLRAGWDGVYGLGAASATQVWARDGDDLAWQTTTEAWRLDPATADATLARIDGGGPGYGAFAEAATLADLDGDGAPDWWQDTEDLLRTSPVVRGAVVSACDLASTAMPEWGDAHPAADFDGDGVVDLAWWAEPDSVGLWSPTAGPLVEGNVDGGLGTVGCDLTGDGVDELWTGGVHDRIVDGVAWVTEGLADAVLAEIRAEPTCLGDLTGDGVPELAEALGSILLYEGARLAAGEASVVGSIVGPGVGHLQAVGDVDGDGLGDLLYYASYQRNDTCVTLASELMAGAALYVEDVTRCVTGGSDFRGGDVDGDGVNEVLYRDGDGVMAWWPVTGATAIAWSPDDDTRDEPLMDVVQDAFGPGVPAIVLGPDPIVVYALGR